MSHSNVSNKDIVVNGCRSYTPRLSIEGIGKYAYLPVFSLTAPNYTLSHLLPKDPASNQSVSRY